MTSNHMPGHAGLTDGSPVAPAGNIDSLKIVSACDTAALALHHAQATEDLARRALEDAKAAVNQARAQYNEALDAGAAAGMVKARLREMVEARLQMMAASGIIAVTDAGGEGKRRRSKAAAKPKVTQEQVQEQAQEGEAAANGGEVAASSEDEVVNSVTAEQPGSLAGADQGASEAEASPVTGQQAESPAVETGVEAPIDAALDQIDAALDTIDDQEGAAPNDVDLDLVDAALDNIDDLDELAEMAVAERLEETAEEDAAAAQEPRSNYKPVNRPVVNSGLWSPNDQRAAG